MPDQWKREFGFENKNPNRMCDYCKHKIRKAFVERNCRTGTHLVVGNECGNHLHDGSYDIPKVIAAIKDRKEREKKFLELKWDKTDKGNFVCKVNNQKVTIVCTEKGNFGVVVNGEWYWKYAEKSVKTLETAKRLAFLLVDL